MKKYGEYSIQYSSERVEKSYGQNGEQPRDSEQAPDRERYSRMRQQPRQFRVSFTAHAHHLSSQTAHDHHQDNYVAQQHQHRRQKHACVEEVAAWQAAAMWLSIGYGHE